MLEAFLALSAVQATALILGGLAILFVSRRAYVDYRIRKLGGVRAPELATNPIGSKYTTLPPSALQGNGGPL
jgi:hypothetical protein